MPEATGVVLLTGAGGGIGSEILRRLLASGYSVGYVERNDEMLARASAAAEGGPTMAQALDVAHLGQVTSFITETESQLGPLTGLVNCAGRFEPMDYEATTPESWMDAISANLLTAMTTCRAVLPLMKARGGGSVVNFASTAFSVAFALGLSSLF